MRFLRQLCMIILLFSSWSLASAATIDFQVDGITDPELKNALNRLKSEEQNFGPDLTEKDIQLIYQQAPNAINQAIQPYGYFKAEVKSLGLTRVKDDKWLAKFHVTLGPPLKLTKLSVKVLGEGAETEKFRQLMAKFPLQQGQTLNMENYNSAKSALTNLASENGFLAARLSKHVIYIDLKNYTSEIDIVFDTGPQYYFGDVTFIDGGYDPEFLQRYVAFKPGDPYSSQALLTLQQHLANTIYFTQVTVTPEVQQANNRWVPIKVSLVESKSQQYKFGIGYGTDTGIRGTLGWEWRHITDTGQYFKTLIQASQLQPSAQARYVIPGKNPVTDEYFIAGSIEHQDINGNRGDTQKISIGRTDEFYGWQRTLALSYQWDRYSIRSAPYEKTNLLLPSITFFRSTTDDILFPRRGYQINLSALGASEHLASNSTFAQVEVAGGMVFSPSDDSRLLLRGDIGYTASGNLDKVPLSLQFFAGGAESIRGYKYQQLGPGRYLLVGSVEFQHRVKNNWWGAVFIDAGNAVDSLSNPGARTIGRTSSQIDSSQLLKYSAGVGVVYVSPVGPIEVTVAKPITDSNLRPRLQFTMGANL